MSDDDVPVAVRLVAAVTLLASLAAATVVTWVCFTGGTIPLLGIEVEGSIGLGIVALLFLDPLILLAGVWVAMAIAVPITWLADRGGR